MLMPSLLAETIGTKAVIPARAGRIRPTGDPDRRGTSHSRARGAHPPDLDVCVVAAPSFPRARGAWGGHQFGSHALPVIPARAGRMDWIAYMEAGLPVIPARAGRIGLAGLHAHPMGSFPRARGASPHVTPHGHSRARAGRMPGILARRRVRPRHSRARGAWLWDRQDMWDVLVIPARAGRMGDWGWDPRGRARHSRARARRMDSRPATWKVSGASRRGTRL